MTSAPSPPARQRVACAHDRRHDGARLHRGDAQQLHSRGAGVRGLHPPPSRYGDAGGSAPLPAAPDAERHAAAEHQQRGLALRFFFTVTLDRPELARRLTVVRQSRRLPAVLSVEERLRFCSRRRRGPSTRRHSPPPTALGCASLEVVALKVGDIADLPSACCCGSSRAKDAKTATPCCRRSCLSWHATGGWRPAPRRGWPPRGWLFPGRNLISAALDPSAQPRRPRRSRCRRDQEASIAAYAAAQLRHTPLEQRYRYPCHPGAAVSQPSWVMPRGHVERCGKIAATAGSLTTRAATAIALGCQGAAAGTGLPRARPICCRSVTSTWSSPSRPRSPLIAYQNKAVVYDLAVHAPQRRRCSPLPPIPDTSGPASALPPPCFIAGASAMTHHPHVHMIVPGGGISLDGTRWVSRRPGFLAGAGALPPVPAALSGRLLDAHAAGRLAFFGEVEGLRDRTAFDAHLAPLQRKDWFVYAKPRFAGPEAVLAYLARYIHRVAISNSRLIGLDERGVTFRYKDYCRNGQARYRTTLAPHEFISSFAPRPAWFHRIRHYGLLASAGCKANIAHARELIAAPAPPKETPVEHDNASTTGIGADHRLAMPSLWWPDDCHRDLRAMRRNPEPRHHPTPGSGARRHGTTVTTSPQHHLPAGELASGTALPSPCSASKRRSHPAEHLGNHRDNGSSGEEFSRPRSSIRRRMRRPAPPAPRPPPHQIPIDDKPPAQPPRVPSLKAFGRRPSVPADRSSTGRYPKPCTSAVVIAAAGERPLSVQSTDLRRRRGGGL